MRNGLNVKYARNHRCSSVSQLWRRGERSRTIMLLHHALLTHIFFHFHIKKQFPEVPVTLKLTLVSLQQFYRTSFDSFAHKLVALQW